MKLAELERDLRSVDPRLRYHICRMQEELIAQRQRLDKAAELVIMLFHTLERLHLVNTQLNERWEKRLRGEPDTDIVESVLNKPDLDS